MDTSLEIANIITIPQDNVELELESKPTPTLTKKKKHSPMRALRVAFHMMRGNSKKPNVILADDESKNVWKKLVGSMRPLHLQSNQSPRLSTQSNGHKFHQMTITLPPPSPSGSSGGSSVFVDFSTEEEPYSPFSPSPASSRYASAIGLNELVSSDEENERPDVIKEECDENGDEKIDSKAEDFIAQFYHQMRLQSLNNVHRDYQERSQRSLGW